MNESGNAFVQSDRGALAIYIHWPYCVSKCPYCDFNSHVGDTQDQEKWRRAYARELEHYAGLLPGRTITSIFFGGGTPSLMEARTVESILGSIARLWTIDPDCEITLEANPSSVEAQKFADFRKAGVNRLSLGVQSFDAEALKFLGRAHDADEARRAIILAASNFPRYSFDLIYARAEQTPAAWEAELRAALTLAGDHLSLYQLTIEPHTQFYVRDRRGEKLTAPDDESVTMFETTQGIMEQAGLPAYEISNHARAGQESRHNLTYWHYEDYIGIGPGAHGRYHTGVARYATEAHKAPDIWLAEVEARRHGIKTATALNETEAMREAVMMGLRLRSGIDKQKWRAKFATPLEQFLPAGKVARLENENYLAQDTVTLRATAAGLQRLNAVLAYVDEESPDL
ncbi:MAG: radical SAM family heme chaperone HemW [Alphaproteobacteria bacterium]|nr:radical SAM family heme chaperone HemW [Alphaproteobacteria bacterium]